MSVRLVSHTSFLEDSSMSLLEQVAYVARVSNPANQSNAQTSEKLVRYLTKHSHWSPFEMVSICLEIVTTRDIARQILRHRSFSFQEFSQRYADPTQHLGFCTRDARMQDHKNRQNSTPATDSRLVHDWNRLQEAVSSSSQAAYEWAVRNGIAKEVARAVLPEGMTETRIYMSGTLRSWIHYIALRTGNGTQVEHAEIAHACARCISSVFPIIEDFVERGGK